MIYNRAGNLDQLYDLEQEPGKMINLAAESLYADLLNEHPGLTAAPERKVFYV